MQRRRDQQPFFTFDLPAPATMAGALLDGPPPGTLYPPPGAPPAGSKPRPAEKPEKPENTYRQQYTIPRGTSGSNPSTESNINSIRKATDKYANAMLGIKAITESREPKDSNNSSTARSDQRENIQWPRDYTREMSSHTSPASRKRLKTISKRSISARGVQRYHSYFNRSCLSSAIEEDKNWEHLHRQLKLSQLIFPLANRSCNRSHSNPKQISTNSNDVAENYCRSWTRHPLLTTEQLTNICCQRNNRSLTQLTLTQLTAESSSLIQNAVVPTNPNDDVLAPATEHASALYNAQRQQISLRLLNTTTQRQLLTSPLLNANIQR
ncbi:guanylate-binding protein 7-like [Dorcoceras hygrometricum]|uniref:Guanylate-binding protein 7-like n=1 Tax=Dorcoceras hygrometricum TaxID=472368 RepID=A0A2Z7CRH2_9LAMI|nr:guanylate-binding protein 7-like [Dorcoceras hygrometricum]